MPAHWRAIVCHNCHRNVAYTIAEDTNGGTPSHILSENPTYCFLCAHSLSDIAGAIGGREGIAGIPGPVSFSRTYNNPPDAKDSVQMRSLVIRWRDRAQYLWPIGIIPDIES